MIKRWVGEYGKEKQKHLLLFLKKTGGKINATIKQSTRFGG